MAARPGGGPVMVVLGDSVAEGQNDPDPAGGWLGWAGRLAHELGVSREETLNVSDPGATIEDVARTQLPAVRELRPALVVLGCGMNDALRGFERAAAAARLDEVFAWARSRGAISLAIPCRGRRSSTWPRCRSSARSARYSAFMISTRNSPVSRASSEYRFPRAPRWKRSPIPGYGAPTEST